MPRINLFKDFFKNGNDWQQIKIVENLMLNFYLKNFPLKSTDFREN